ncbi:hypothetical protein KORDIASMS9_01857 [Kordia sp. SMS9]|uniref:restriction endonuclease n=1 Tax=Kordia sp. SMS9 TaxID=2282170 RepID=UPI000E0D3540|nr:restriction endonuclease [Kordia sp. SMS9]AXG69632.1 hypothetical protein KORDIASMS9_01857 [Kordia sp. SMS9]
MQNYLAVSELSDIELDIINNLINGRNENDSIRAKSYFRNSFTKSEGILKTSKISQSLYLESLSELAKVEYNAKERTLTWNLLLKKLRDFSNSSPKSENTIMICCDSIISYIQEPFIDKDNQLIRKTLTMLKGKIDSIIKDKGVLQSAELLIKKAAILRHFAYFQVTNDSKKIAIEQALRCVEKSISISDETWYAYNELGNCYRQFSNFAKKIFIYNERIGLAEESLKHSQHIEITVHNTIALCILYKETYQTAPFIEAFKTYEKIEKNRRRFLKNSFLLAEVVTNMYFSKYPKEMLDEYLDKADSILNEAINAGYSDARIISNLAYIKAAKGEISVGKYVLKTLNHSNTSTFDWNNIIETLDLIKHSEDLFAQGFVLGIDDSNIWNKLGSFAINFLDDIDLGIKMYNVALSFNKSNPIVLTNLARALLKTPLNEAVIEEAEYYISKAAALSNFRFQWWREVREEIHAIQSESFEVETIQPLKKKFNFSKIADLYKYFLFLKEMKDPQKRGYEFEKLIKSYFKISLGNSIGSHRITASSSMQIDGAFYFQKEFYRVEIKWTKSKSDHTDINDFYFKLNTIGVTGLFISMNGFTDSAINRVKSLKKEVKILLMDGDEIEKTLKGSPTFDEAIRVKQLYFYLEDNPYHIIDAV